MSYIIDIKIITGKNAKAPAGYTRLDVDLNKGAKGEYIYLCYKEGNSGNGLVDLFVWSSSKSGIPAIGNGCEPIKYDLNKGAKGNYIYLYKKMADERTARVAGIKSLMIITGKNTKTPDGFSKIDVELNEGAGGEYIYLCYARNFSQTDWMATIDGKRSIAELSIPGTHDTLAFSFKGFLGKAGEKSARTQLLNVDQQLAAGGRYLDIRIDKDCDGRHGEAMCKTTFKNAMDSMTNFLKAHPSEAIFFRLMNQGSHGNHNGNKEFRAKITEILNAAAPYLYKTKKDSAGDAVVPTLDEVRGKIVILDRLNEKATYSTFANGLGLMFGMIAWEEKWQDPKINNKMDRIYRHIEAHKDLPKILFGNGVNATGTDVEVVFGTYIPIYYAKKCNPRMCYYLCTTNYRTGFVAFDFFTAELADRIITHNIPLMMSV